MRILITGIGDAFTRLHFSTGCLIEAPGGLVMIDCADLVHRVLHEASGKSGWKIDASKIDHILLTHLHGDHANGLESFGFHRRFIGSKLGLPQPSIHTHAKAADRLWEKLSPAMDGGGQNTLETYYDLNLLEFESTNHIAGLEVRIRQTQHPIPTIGLLISDGKSTLGWSGDTPYEQAHIDWLSEADLIVHECNLGAAHTHIEQLNALPQTLRQKTRLIHLPDSFDTSNTDLIRLVEGEVLEI